MLLLKSPRMGPRPERALPKHQDLSKYLSPALVDRGHGVDNKEDLFRLCSQHFAMHAHSVSETEIRESLLKRESAQNTGVCHGVAMPHATIDNLDKTYLFIEVLEQPLDYDAPDNQPVDVVFATIGPPKDRQLHLILLAALSGKILSTGLLDRMRHSESSEELYGIVATALKQKG